MTPETQEVLSRGFDLALVAGFGYFLWSCVREFWQ